jgi:hypothetical protein
MSAMVQAVSLTMVAGVGRGQSTASGENLRRHEASWFP